jgi:hypothetical protein
MVTPAPPTRRRRLLIPLDSELFERLEHVADRELRTAEQQAAHIIRRSLRRLRQPEQAGVERAS